MKKLLLPLIFSLIILPSLAQNYVPIPTRNIEWLEYRSFEHPQGKTIDWHGIFHSYLGKDTVINNYTYTEIIHDENYYYSLGFGPIFQHTIRDSIFFRNDSINKKAYLKYKNDTSEYMFFDFDLVVGDTLPLLGKVSTNSSNNQYRWIVDSVSTEFINGKQRKVFHFLNGSSSRLRLIEGMGFTSSFIYIPRYLYPSPAQGYLDHANEFRLLKVCENGSSIYSNVRNFFWGVPLPNTCNLTTSTNSENTFQKRDFILYPNPTIDELHVRANQSFSYAVVVIIDQLGRVVKEKKLSGLFNEISLNVSDLKRGVYILKFYGNKREVYSQKLVIGIE